MLSGDIINYGVLYPVDWLKNVTEALLLYQMFLGANKDNFRIKKLKI